MEYERDYDTISNSFTRNNPEIIIKGTEGLRNKRMSGDHPGYNIIRIGQNTEWSPGDLRTRAVTQYPVKTIS